MLRLSLAEIEFPVAWTMYRNMASPLQAVALTFLGSSSTAYPSGIIRVTCMVTFSVVSNSMGRCLSCWSKGLEDMKGMMVGLMYKKSPAASASLVKVTLSVTFAVPLPSKATLSAVIPFSFSISSSMYLSSEPALRKSELKS